MQCGLRGEAVAGGCCDELGGLRVESSEARIENLSVSVPRRYYLFHMYNVLKFDNKCENPFYSGCSSAPFRHSSNPIIFLMAAMGSSSPCAFSNSFIASGSMLESILGKRKMMPAENAA